MSRNLDDLASEVHHLKLVITILITQIHKLGGSEKVLDHALSIMSTQDIRPMVALEQISTTKGE
jgi:hypothetical protein